MHGEVPFLGASSIGYHHAIRAIPNTAAHLATNRAFAAHASGLAVPTVRRVHRTSRSGMDIWVQA